MKYSQQPPAESFAATVLETTAGEMTLSVPTPIAADTRVEFRLDSGEMMAGSIRYCRQVGEDLFHIGIQRAGVDEVLERRKEPRYPAGGLAEIRLIGENGGSWRMAASVFDVSRGGLGMNVKERIAPGTPVELTFQGVTATGIVRNCSRHSGGFRVGLALTKLEPYRQDHEPRHIPLITPLMENLTRTRQWLVRSIRSRTPRES